MILWQQFMRVLHSDQSHGIPLFSLQTVNSLIGPLRLISVVFHSFVANSEKSIIASRDIICDSKISDEFHFSAVHFVLNHLWYYWTHYLMHVTITYFIL